MNFINSNWWSIWITTTYIDEKITEQHEYTDQEIEALRVEGYIQEDLKWVQYMIRC